MRWTIFSGGRKMNLATVSLLAIGGTAIALYLPPRITSVFADAPRDPAAIRAALKPAASAPVVPDNCTKVRRGTLSLSFDLSGDFEPVDPFAAKLKFKRYAGDLIIKHAAAPGSTVAKGDTLLELETDKIDVLIAAAENDLKSSDAALAKADADTKLGEQGDALARTEAKKSTDNAKEELARWDKADGEAALASAKMQSRQMASYVDDQSDELNELKKMYKSEDITNATADIVMKRAVRSLELSTEMAKITNVLTDKTITFELPISRDKLVLQADQRALALQQLTVAQQEGKVQRETTLATARASDIEAHKNLDELKTDREKLTISSPCDGVLVYGSFAHHAWTEIEPEHYKAGEKVAAEQTLMTVYAPGKMKLAIEWPERSLILLGSKLPAKVIPVALPEITYDGVCQPAKIFGAAKDTGQVFDVTVALPTVDPQLVPGYKADVTIDAGKRENVLLVPGSAVHFGKVWLKTDGEPKPCPVVCGATDGHQTEIKSGLSEGDIILKAGKPTDEEK